MHWSRLQLWLYIKDPGDSEKTTDLLMALVGQGQSYLSWSSAISLSLDHNSSLCAGEAPDCPIDTFAQLFIQWRNV